MYKIIGGDHKEYGPVSAEELRRWISEGRLNGQSLAQSEGAAEWRPLVTFPEFADALHLPGGVPASVPAMAAPVLSGEALAAHLLARQPQLQVGRCLSRSWQLLSSNFGLLFGACFLFWILRTIMQFVPFGSPLFWVIHGAFYGGVYFVFIQRIRAQPASVGDAFSGFNIAFGQLVLVGIVTSFLNGLLFCCFLIPGIYFLIAWWFSIPLVVDRRLEFWPAMELSRKVVTRVWFEVFLLLLVAYLPTILMLIFMQVKVMLTTTPQMRDIMASNPPDFARIFSLMFQVARENWGLIMASKVVALVNLPFAMGAMMYAYEDLFGTRPATNP